MLGSASHTPHHIVAPQPVSQPASLGQASGQSAIEAYKQWLRSAERQMNGVESGRLSEEETVAPLPPPPDTLMQQRASTSRLTHGTPFVMPQNLPQSYQQPQAVGAESMVRFLRWRIFPSKYMSTLQVSDWYASLPGQSNEPPPPPTAEGAKGIAHRIAKSEVRRIPSVFP